jgi:hypothetical protein
MSFVAGYCDKIRGSEFRRHEANILMGVQTARRGRLHTVGFFYSLRESQAERPWRGFMAWSLSKALPKLKTHR